MTGLLILGVSSTLSGCIDIGGILGGDKKDPQKNAGETAPMTAGTDPATSPINGEIPSGDDPLDQGNELLSDIEKGIVALAMSPMDPFLIAMPVQPLMVTDEDFEKLSPYYKSLVAAYPLITILDPVIDASSPDGTMMADGSMGGGMGGGSMSGGGPVDAGPTKAEIIASALGSITVNGISFNKSTPMAILNIGGNATTFAKKGSNLNVNGYTVNVAKITQTEVVLKTNGQSRTVQIADIFGFARGGTTANAGGTPATAAGSPGAAPTANQPSAQQIDQIVNDLLKE